MYDLIILGGGPAGYNAAERATQGGFKTLLLEGNKLGGVCLNEGCIPTKTLLYSAKIYDYAKHSEAYGVSFEGAKIDHAKVVERKDKIVKMLVGGVASSMKKYGVDVVSEYGEITGRGQEGFTVKAGDKEYIGKKLLICTGSEAAVPPIPGLRESVESGFAMTNHEILDMKTLPEKLVVIGGGVIGLEMASYFVSVGVKVTVIEMLDHIAGPTDREISNILLKNYKNRGVEFLLGAKVTSVGKDCVNYELDGKEQSAKADNVLVSIGRRAVTRNTGIEKIGVLTERGAIVTDEHCRTNIDNVYAAGDVNGKLMLAHTGYREGEVAVNNMLGIDDTVDYVSIPSVIYTNPEVATVGLSEEEAKEKGIEYKKGTYTLNFSGRYMAENEGGNGILKVLVDKEHNSVIGVSMIGNYASEIVFGFGMMVAKKMRLDALKKIVFPHPTVGEVVREAIFSL